MILESEIIVHFVLIDDIAGHNDLLAEQLRKACASIHIPCDIALITNDPAQVESYAKTCTQPTVYFMDIQLEENTLTLPLAQTIIKNNCESYIIYVSAHAHYALECLHTHAFDFLLKPWTKKQLIACLEAVWQSHARHQLTLPLQVHLGTHTVMTSLNDILYFSRDKMNLCMYLENGSTLTWRESFDHLLARLQGGFFCLCHRSYLINLQKVRKIDWEERTITLSNGLVLPFSRRREQALRNLLKNMEGI